jgi:hypothetical protein
MIISCVMALKQEFTGQLSCLLQLERYQDSIHHDAMNPGRTRAVAVPNHISIHLTYSYLTVNIAVYHPGSTRTRSSYKLKYVHQIVPQRTPEENQQQQQQHLQHPQQPESSSSSDSMLHPKIKKTISAIIPVGFIALPPLVLGPARYIMSIFMH